MSKTRPTQRTLEALRKDGVTVDIVERWLPIKAMPGGGIRRDLFNAIDVLCILDNQITGIQCGAGSGHSAHKKKCLAEPRMIEWLQAGGRLILHSWSQQGPAGKRKLWQCRKEELTLVDYQQTQDLFA